MKCRKAYAIIPVGENDRSAHVAQQKAPEVATPGLFYSVLGGWLNPKAGYQLFFSVQPFADVVGNYTCQNREKKMTEVHSCGSPPFSTCLGAVASFIISQGQKCHKKPFPLVYYQSHKEKSVKGGHRPQRLPLILFFVGYNAGGENGCPSVSLLPPVLHCPFRRKKVKGGLRPFFICCTR